GCSKRAALKNEPARCPFVCRKIAAMPSSTDELDATGLRDAQWFARRLRERAQERIVHSFRAQLAGGAEPADEDLAIFAKLAAEEHRLGMRQAMPAAK